MKRREFLAVAAAASASFSIPRVFAAPHTSGGISSQPSSRLDAGATVGDTAGKLLILIELKGGNDGLNTVVPFADSTYYALRRHIAIPRERVLPLDAHTALHPALHPLMSSWRDGQLAVVQGVGCSHAHASHFRSAEIWETGSCANVYRRDGWLSRMVGQWATMGQSVVTASFGSAEAGPFASAATRSASDNAWKRVDDPDAASYADEADADISGPVTNARLDSLAGAPTFRDSIEAALRTIFDDARPHATGAIRLTLDGFDTHSNQPMRHATLLNQLADGCATLRAELMRRGRWRDALIVTYSEFGRSVQENTDRGTEHGGASAHFLMGGAVQGGLYGRAPDLTRLDDNGNLPVAVDFRQLYATVLGPFLKLDVKAVLHDDIQPLPLLRA
ncbi:DUF1501 domain-containing protein [Burkholderia sp. Ac-20365]|uniref:DUF1501 domain-containing protein n=1 Tax=Burkholderia sp. Ac-20365 TaxID=2703897 RepID=UPI00197B4F0B|nr:DUF1501 domain-containing protein [Burkholderia sp. Ac-20365]MBN3767020.1 DUF1501 domain-containing protein [Burkholderia sp. Ac-20365]